MSAGSENVTIAHRSVAENLLRKYRNGGADAHGQCPAITEHAFPHQPFWLHLLQISNHSQCPCTPPRHSIVTPEGSGAMLSTMPGHITYSTTQENLRPHTYGLIVRIIQQWRELPRRAVVGISQIRLKHAHIGIANLVGEVHGYVVVLVGIPDIKQNCLIYVPNVDQG